MIIPIECGSNASFTPAEECIPPEGAIEITENGEFDVAQYASASVDVSGGSGASDTEYVSFVVAGNPGEVGSVDLAYSGNGFPIAVVVQVKSAISQTLTNGSYVFLSLTKIDTSSMAYDGDSARYIATTRSGTTFGHLNPSTNGYISPPDGVIDGHAYRSVGIVKEDGTIKLKYFVANGEVNKYGLSSGIEYEAFIHYSA